MEVVEEGEGMEVRGLSGCRVRRVDGWRKAGIVEEWWKAGRKGVEEGGDC